MDGGGGGGGGGVPLGWGTGEGEEGGGIVFYQPSFNASRTLPWQAAQPCNQGYRDQSTPRLQAASSKLSVIV